METINFEQISFSIITYSGTAKSNAIIAISEAKKANFAKAHKLIKEAEENIIDAEKTHMQVIQQEAQGIKLNIPVLYMHAEDQMMSSQMVIELAKEFISLYEILKTKKIIE